MILFKNENKCIPGVNCIVLEVEGLGYVYVSKETYDQAVILNERLEGDIGVLADILGADDRHAESIEYFTEVAPEPLNILSPFLVFISDKAELGTDFEKICGALHQISVVTDFNEITKVPKELRASLNFSKTFVSRYVSSWEAMEKKLTMADVDIESIKVSALEKLLERIVPLIQPVSSAVAQKVPAVENKHVSSSTTDNTEVVENKDAALEKHNEDDKSDTDNSDNTDDANDDKPVLDFSVFAELLDPEPEENDKDEKKENSVSETKRVITAEDIIKSKNLKDVSKDKMDKEINEAGKIAALVNKFGGK